MGGGEEDAARRGRTEGVPGGHQDVYFHKRLAQNTTGKVLGA